ncbi:hypothetical protein HWV62_18250 [Athelia sp. TMB]|nr:hypothetical protein HWV62_18250 [Athelia sp. TMB]
METFVDGLAQGFYIHSCPKMRYKGEYSPSYLADPEDYTWHPLKRCVELLDKNRYACFTHPDHSLEGPPVLINEPAPQIPNNQLMDILVIKSIENATMNVEPVVRDDPILRSIAPLGWRLA